MPEPGKARLEVIDGGKDLDRKAALRELYAKYGGSVFGRCQYLLKDRSKAEDAMQDVFAKAISNYSKFRAEASPLTWLMKIATHHCLNLLRSEHGWRSAFQSLRQPRPEAQHVPAMEIREAVRHLLSRFDLETQAAVIHYHVDEMTLEEVAAVLNRSVPTVRKRLQHFAEQSGREWN
ncbi:MAG TPA: sigma-70 family RNA polymerase sigma factor [Myxococcaceae bacterium]|nr:sigma-70 family RNA polymerase sigma factor [Myxococcaceae bacterium]